MDSALFHPVPFAPTSPSQPCVFVFFKGCPSSSIVAAGVWPSKESASELSLLLLLLLLATLASTAAIIYVANKTSMLGRMFVAFVHFFI